MKIRDRVGLALLSERSKENEERLGRTLAMWDHILEKRNWLLEDLDVQEAISQTTSSLHHRRDILLTGSADVTETERRNAVAESRRLYRWTSLGHRLVSLWTDFGFGQNIEVAPRDPAAQEVWDEFWSARRNMPVLRARDLHRLSDSVLNDGELFWVAFMDRATGQTTIRTVPTEEWSDLVTDPDDKSVVQFFKREMSGDLGAPLEMYYRNWLYEEGDEDKTALGDEAGRADDYPTDAQRADQQRPEVDVAVMHTARDQDERMRGWPMLTQGEFWIRAYRKLALDLLSVTERNALYGVHWKTKGGSRAVDYLTRTLQSAMTSSTADGETNPPPGAGSDFVGNEAVSAETPPLNRAATEGANVTSMVIGQAGLAGGVYPHWLGRGEAYRLATASSMEEPVRRQFARYQAWWADVWRELCHLVLWSAQTYGGAVYHSVETDAMGNEVVGEQIDAFEVDVDVNTDALLAEQDVSELSDALVALAPYIPDAETLTRIALQALNVPDAQSILDIAYPKDSQGSEEMRMRKIDAGVVIATLRHLAEDDPDDTQRRIVAAQALSVMEDSNGNGRVGVPG